MLEWHDLRFATPRPKEFDERDQLRAVIVAQGEEGVRILLRRLVVESAQEDEELVLLQGTTPVLITSLEGAQDGALVERAVQAMHELCSGSEFPAGAAHLAGRRLRRRALALKIGPQLVPHRRALLPLEIDRVVGRGVVVGHLDDGANYARAVRLLVPCLRSCLEP